MSANFMKMSVRGAKLISATVLAVLLAAITWPGQAADFGAPKPSRGDANSKAPCMIEAEGKWKCHLATEKQCKDGAARANARFLWSRSARVCR